MNAIDAARFARVEALLDAALEQPEIERKTFLLTQEPDASIRAEVLELLCAVSASEGFLEATATPASELEGHRAGAWTLVRRIGRGGMGEVWLGERADGRFEQQVAVKLLRQGVDDAPRFLREARLLARLQHRNIARLIDAGNLPDGTPFMVMELIEGMPLLRHCRERGMELPARLALFARICEVVAFAHRHLIVHRDLKPDNILVRADGEPVLLDFGIARPLDADQGHTRDLRLTPQYAAPEQLAGGEQSTLTDVYALGLLLHELLTEHPPWGEIAGAGVLALLQRAQAGPPPAPSSQATSKAVAIRLRGDLDAIVHKALRPEPESRYDSADALAQDVRRYLAHEPVAARGSAFGYRARRFLRRYWLAAGVLLFVFVGLVGAVMAISMAQQEAVRERDIAQAEARRNRAVRDYLSLMFRDASQRANEGTPLTAKAVLDQAAARVASDFGNEPATTAQVLHALGELHFHIGDYAAAEPLLRRWLAHEAVIGDPLTAAEVRATLAEVVLRMGQREEATELLQQAQAFWQADPDRHADVLLASRMLQARLQRESGDAAGALATLESALPQRLQRSGREHFESAALYTNLGVAYVQAGKLDEGIAASQEAMTLWRALDLSSGNDALNTLNNLAAAQFRKGDLASAETTFADALRLRRQLFGPSAATAALIGNYARVLQGLARHGEALEYAGEAEVMAQQHAGSGSPLTQATRITRAESLLALQRVDDAGEALAAYAAEDTTALPTSLQLRAALVRAETHQRRSQADATRQALDEAEALSAQLGVAAEPFRARLDALRAR